MAAGFRDLFAWLFHWWSSSEATIAVACDPPIVEARYGGGRVELKARWQADPALVTPLIQNDAIQEP